MIIDLKVGKLTHQDLGQMQMYVNYYTRQLMNKGDNIPIGIVLCADKNDSVVKYTLSEGDNQIFASKYKLYMPTEEELKREIAKEQEILKLKKFWKILQVTSFNVFSKSKITAENPRMKWKTLTGWGDLAGIISLLFFLVLGLGLELVVQLIVWVYKKHSKV